MAGLGLARPLGAYSALLERPDVAGTLLWSARTAGALALAVGIVAAVGFVPGAVGLLRGTPDEAAVGAISVSVVAWTVVAVGRFSETSYGYDHVHERNAITALPLIIVGALAWAQRGLPRPPLPAIAGALGVVGCVAAIRQGDLLATFDVDMPTLHVWRTLDASTWPASRLVLLAALVGGAVALRTNRAWVVPLVAGLAMAVAVPLQGTDVPRSKTEALGWIDRAVGRDARVLVVTANVDDCERRSLEEAALWTELFNLSAVRAGHLVRDNAVANWDSPRLTVDRDGVLQEDGRPVSEALIALDSRLRVSGREVARLPPNVLGDHPGARVGMTLWRVDPPLRILNTGVLAASGCRDQG